MLIKRLFMALLAMITLIILSISEKESDKAIVSRTEQGIHTLNRKNSPLLTFKQCTINYL